MGEDVAVCVPGSVVVFGEGTAGWSEALGALSQGLYLKRVSSGGQYPSPGCSSSIPMSTASEAVWGASPIPAAQPVALFARLDQEFSC